MYMKFMTLKNIQIKYSLIILLLLPLTAFALNSDQHKIAELSADQAHYDRTHNITIYTGNIKFKQGTTKLEADKVIIYDNPKATKSKNKVARIVAFGNRAYYSTLHDGKNDLLHARANMIEYFPHTGIAILKGDGEITQQGNELNGPYIVYNLHKQTISVTPAKKDKIKIILQP